MASVSDIGSSGEEAVHTYSVTAHVLYKGHGKPVKVSHNFGTELRIEIYFLAPLLCIEFLPFCTFVALCVRCVELCNIVQRNTP